MKDFVAAPGKKRVQVPKEEEAVEDDS
jgi:hypothetical protein